MNGKELYPVRSVVEREHHKAAEPGYLPMPALYAQKAKRRAKARTCLRIIGGLSWLAGLLVIAVVAAGIEQDKLSGWQMVVMAAVGLGLLMITAVVSQMKEGEDACERI